jgi:hypothetical protein
MILGLLIPSPVPKPEELMLKRMQVKNNAHMLRKIRMASFKKNSNQKNLMLSVKRMRQSLKKQTLSVRLQLHPIVVIPKNLKVAYFLQLNPSKLVLKSLFPWEKLQIQQI